MDDRLIAWFGRCAKGGGRRDTRTGVEYNSNEICIRECCGLTSWEREKRSGIGRLAFAAIKIGLCLWMVLAGLNLAVPTASAESIYYQEYPQGTIGYKHPEIRFEITKNEISASLISHRMYLDGTVVEASLNQDATALTYTSVEELQPGQHTVEVVLTYAGYESFREKWTFTVSELAFGEVPVIQTADQIEGLKAVNDYRTLFGLDEVQINNLLNHAALAHAQYLAVNHEDDSDLSLHEESPDGMGFIGETVSERRQYMGYMHALAEDVSYGLGSLVDSIDGLFDAPYHRTPFLDPSMYEIGIAQAGDYVVIEFGFKDEVPEGVEMVVSPAPGDTDVSTTFDGYEVPDPLRRHTSYKYPVGYALMATLTGDSLESIRLVDARLTDGDGQRVRLLTDTPANDDELYTEVILLPVDPLLPDTGYTASVKIEATLNDGSTQTLDKTWSFRTEQSPGMGRQKLHEDAAAYTAQLGQFRADKHVVRFRLTGSSYELDGVSFPMSRPVYLADGSSYLWIRDLSAALDAAVSWDGGRQAAIYSKDGRRITFYTTRDVYEINGAERSTDTPAQLVDDATFVPVRLLSEVLGAEVVYDSPSQTVQITY